MLGTTSRTVQLAFLLLVGFIIFLLARAPVHRSSSSRPNSKLRVEEPVVVILVHPSPSLSKVANFELKRVISRTWAKDVDDLGAAVFFVGEHDGEIVMRRPSEFQSTSQSQSTRFGPGSSGAGNGGSLDEHPMRKMLIPSILENGQTDDPSGLLKAYNFLYNNTNWYAGPMAQTYPFVLSTDTTHFINVENLVSTLLSSRPRRLLAMKDDLEFTGTTSEASECSAEDFGDKASIASTSQDGRQHPHWTHSKTHLISRQMLTMVGPHLHQCIQSPKSTPQSSELAFYTCIRKWTSNPHFWEKGYCGRFSALRFQAPSSTYYASRKEPRMPPPSPEEFESLFHRRQKEKTGNQQQESANRDIRDDRIGETLAHHDDIQERGLPSLTTTPWWVVGSGLTRPEDFAFVSQELEAHSKN